MWKGIEVRPAVTVRAGHDYASSSPVHVHLLIPLCQLALDHDRDLDRASLSKVVLSKRHSRLYAGRVLLVYRGDTMCFDLFASSSRYTMVQLPGESFRDS
jgi:hypothetical protein